MDQAKNTNESFAQLQTVYPEPRWDAKMYLSESDLKKEAQALSQESLPSPSEPSQN